MNNQVLEIRLSPKGIKPVRNGHPWVFRNALGGRPRPAALPPDVLRTVTGNGLCWDHTRPAIVSDPTGTPIGWGIYNEASRLALRMINRNPSSAIHRGTFEELIRAACRRRDSLFLQGDTDAFRLLFGEGDGFPGLVADRFGTDLVLEFSGAFAWDNRRWIAEEFRRTCSAERIRLLPDREMLGREGVSPTDDREGDRDHDDAREQDAGDASSSVVIHENGLPWRVRPGSGQKTGHYSDQRENRRRAGELARGCAVLDAFCYHGGFGLTALRCGADRVVCVDSSGAALEMLEENRSLQEAPRERIEVMRGDVFEMLRADAVVPEGVASFDLVILDPPKLAPARRHRDAGLRAYKDLNMAALRLMKPGARLITFSCSGVVTREEFRTALAWAAVDARRVVRIEEVYSQGADHPVPLHFPEAEYLKGYLLALD